MKEPMMLLVMKSIVVHDEGEIISPLEENLVCILDNDLDDESNNYLLLANKGSSSSSEDSDNSGELLQKPKEWFQLTRSLSMP